MDIDAVLLEEDPQKAFFALLKCVLDEPYKQYKHRVPELVQVIAKSGNAEICFDTLHASGRRAGRDPTTLELGKPFLSDEDKKLLLEGVISGGPQWISETIREVFITGDQKTELLRVLAKHAEGCQRELYWVRETLKWGRLRDDEKKSLKRALQKK